MTKNFTLSFLLFFLVFFSDFFINNTVVFAQLRTIKSQITDDITKEPLIQATVIIKGTNQGTLTDENGNYELQNVNVGDILVISYAGYDSKEILVTSTGLILIRTGFNAKEISENYKQFFETKDSIAFDFRTFKMQQSTNEQLNKKNKKKPIGEADFLGNGTVLRDSNYVKKYNENSSHIQRIKIRNGKIIFGYSLENLYNKGFRNNIALQYISTWEVSTPNKAPLMQTQFAQGRQNTYQKGDLFSYGANINTLAYNQNQQIVPIGTGIGMPIHTHNAYNILQKSVLQGHHLQFQSRGHFWEQTINLQYQTQTGILPKQKQDFYNLYGNVIYKKHKFNLKLSQTEDRLPVFGANLQNIMAGIYSNSPTFNPTNATLLPQSTQQENPVFYAQNVPDKSLHRQFAVNIEPYIEDFRWTGNSYYKRHEINIKTNVGINFQEKNNLFGAMPQMANSPQGRLAERKIADNIVFGFVSFMYKNNNEHKNIYQTFGLRYYQEYQSTNLQRQDAFGFFGNRNENILQFEQANQRFFTQFNSERLIYQPTFVYNIKSNDWEWFEFKTSLKKYHSSTLPNAKTLDYILPTAEIDVNVSDFLRKIGVENFDIKNYNFYFFSKFSVNAQEAPLLYNQFQFNSLKTPISQYRGYYENTELTWHKGLTPEISQKFNIGTEIELFAYSDNPLRLVFNYFQNHTQNIILPIAQNNTFALNNAIDMRNGGWELELEFKASKYKYHGFDGGNYVFRFNSKIGFSRYNPVVTAIHTGQSQIPIAGYSEISTQAIVGQPLGVIVGSGYLRNAEGQKIIDFDGFPKVNPTPQILGNPNPDFVMTWWNEITNDFFGFACTLEYRHGGYVWNGTQNAMNYWGTSTQSAQERTIQNHIFEGVNPNGQPNNIAVDFANPNLPFEQNRFVRYGIEGVGEEAIVRATSLRIKEICFSHNLRNFVFKKHNKQGYYSYYYYGESQRKFAVIIKLYASNILLYSPNTSSDPNTTLMGYAQGSGLDFMNVPATFQMGCKLVVSF